MVLYQTRVMPANITTKSGLKSGTIRDDVFTALIALRTRSSELESRLASYDDEELKEIFWGLEAASAVAWQVQAALVAHLRAKGTYGSNAVREVSKFLGYPERRIHELAQIHDEILSKRPDLRDTLLEKGHYLVALRAERYSKDPIKMLEEALDGQMGVRALRSYVETGKESACVRTIYFELRPSAIKPDDPVQQQYFSPMARTIKHHGKFYLELKISESFVKQMD